MSVVSLQQFILPKEGSAAEECEDAIAVNEAALRFALADGATEAFASGAWARTLAENWVNSDAPPLAKDDLVTWCETQGATWHTQWQEKKLSWFAAAKEQQGAFAAFVGVELKRTEHGGKARLIALGDACLLHLRGGELRRALPLDDAAAFNSAPVLVSSRPALHKAAFEQTVTSSFRWQRGDVLWLVSDALAAWLLHALADKSDKAEHFKELLASSRHNELATMLRAEKTSGCLRDDDVAALRIECAGND